MNKFDLVVVGAGTAGAMAAKTAAELGLKTCLIDRKSKNNIGDKVCGDAIGRHHFDNLDISPPKGDELSGEIIGIDVYSPDKETLFRCQGEGLHGFIINRREFGQRLLNDAIDAGVEFFDKTQAFNLIIKDEFVVGVKGKERRSNVPVELYGDVVIDASGFNTVLREQVPTDWGIEARIDKEDVIVCYREIRKLNSEVENQEHCKIYLNQKIAPGGYYWIFPKGKDKVNVGLGLQMKKGHKNPKQRFHDYVANQPLFKNTKIIISGGGVVSTRRPINNMVGNGILFVGDAACQPNPIHGGGIGSSMMAGKIASQIASNAIQNEDVSKEMLWSYNIKFMMMYGAKAASLDVFRIFLQKCGDDELNRGMQQRLIKEEDVLRASLGEDLKLNITDTAQRLFRGLKRLKFLLALKKTADKMKEIKFLYKNYPQPEGFDEWHQKIDSIINEMMVITF